MYLDKNTDCIVEDEEDNSSNSDSRRARRAWTYSFSENGAKTAYSNLKTAYRPDRLQQMARRPLTDLTLNRIGSLSLKNTFGSPLAARSRIFPAVSPVHAPVWAYFAIPAASAGCLSPRALPAFDAASQEIPASWNGLRHRPPSGKRFSIFTQEICICWPQHNLLTRLQKLGTIFTTNSPVSRMKVKF